MQFQVSLYCFCFSLYASHWRLETVSIWQDYSAMQQCWVIMCVRFSVPLCFVPCRRWWTLWTISWASANGLQHRACFIWKFICVELTEFRPSFYIRTYQHMPRMNNIKLLIKWQTRCNCVKGKAIPLQAWRGPEGSRRLRFPHFKTLGTWRW